MFETDADGFQVAGEVLDFLQELVDIANRSSVVFYTIDARGWSTQDLPRRTIPRCKPGHDERVSQARQ